MPKISLRFDQDQSWKCQIYAPDISKICLGWGGLGLVCVIQLPDLMCNKGREREREKVQGEREHYSENPSSPDVEVGQGKNGLGLGCATSVKLDLIW